MSWFPTLLAAVFPVLVIIAALKDVTTFTIPNWLNLSLFAAFFPAAFAAGLPLGEIGMNLAVSMGCLAAGIIMFAFRWIGGGDAKLLAAAGLWLGLPALMPFLVITAFAGGGLALGLLTLRSDFARGMIPAGPGWVERLREPKGDAPYGVAIAAGGLFAFPQCALLVASLG